MLGATGFTGRLVVEALARRGLALEVAGRGQGVEAAASMEGPEAYVFTARAAAGLAARALDGARRPGFVTPSRLLGLEALTSVDGVRLDPAATRTTQEGSQR